jgi:tRNA (guanine37-N1)-methyltransferase
MRIDILTIFPEMFVSPFSTSIIKRAQNGDKVDITVHDLRHWTTDKHRTVDDRPYGGGPGMVMMVEPIDKALQSLKTPKSHILVTSAKGTLFTQPLALRYSRKNHLIIITGHYEGVDQRIHDHLVDDVVSIGEYVLTGGELPAMVITDAVVRLLPGVLSEPTSLEDESHKEPGYLEYPQYTRPESYKSWTVPGTLLSGNHAAIAKWRAQHSRHKKQ